MYSKKNKIMEFLIENNDKEYETFELSKKLNIPKSTVNDYMLELENDSKVTRRKEGYCVYWRATIKEKSLAQILISKPWNGKLLSSFLLILGG